VLAREAAADWGLQCMRYEIRDISPPAGVRSAMELQVQSALADHADHTSCIACMAAECSFENCHFVYVWQAPQDSMLPFVSLAGVRSSCVPLCFWQSNPTSLLQQSSLHCSAHFAQQEVLKQHYELGQ